MGKRRTGKRSRKRRKGGRERGGVGKGRHDGKGDEKKEKMERRRTMHG